MPIRVLIVDDSKAMCNFLSGVLATDPEIEVVGYALDPYEARSLIKTLRPHVLTLDVEMPRMDGLTFLKNLMRLHPMPVVMLSSLTSAGGEVTLEALSAGALDFMVKRHPGSGAEYDAYVKEIVSKVKSAGQTQIGRTTGKGVARVNCPDYPAWKRQLKTSKPESARLKSVIAIGASTGGPEAIREVLESLYIPDTCLLLSQHMPARFMSQFARRLSGFSKYRVAVAQDEEPLVPGQCYVAPGDRHMLLNRRTGELCIKLDDGPPRSGHRPSVDAMFESLAEQSSGVAAGILLTGMGRDGAVGMKKLRDSRAFTVAQDQSSSAVWGMPGAAVSLDAVDACLSLRDIGPTMEALFSEN